MLTIERSTDPGAAEGACHRDNRLSGRCCRPVLDQALVDALGAGRPAGHPALDLDLDRFNPIVEVGKLFGLGKRSGGRATIMASTTTRRYCHAL